MTKAASLDSLLKEAFQSYRQRLLRPYIPSLPPRNLSRLLFLNFIEIISLQERALLNRVSSSCQKGLTATRQGELGIASDHFLNARAHLESMDGGGRIAWLLGVSTYQPGIAYLELKNGLHEKSRERLDWAMNADLELELSGLLFMQVRRIQHGHNIARIEFSLGKRFVAIELVGEIIAYTEGKINKLNYHHDWRPKSLQEVPRETLWLLMREIVGETAGRIVAGSSPEEEWSTLIETARLIQRSDTKSFPQVHYALTAQSKRLSNEPEHYLRNLISFFQTDIRYCHLLWQALMLDFAKFCKYQDTSDSQRILEIVKRDSAKWKGTPPILRDFFTDDQAKNYCSSDS